MTIQSLVSYDQSQEQACCTQGVLERATVTAMLAGYVSSQQRATNKITSTVVNTEAQTFRSWPRHQAAYSLGGSSSYWIWSNKKANWARFGRESDFHNRLGYLRRTWPWKRYREGELPWESGACAWASASHSLPAQHSEWNVSPPTPGLLSSARPTREVGLWV